MCGDLLKIVSCPSNAEWDISRNFNGFSYFLRDHWKLQGVNATYSNWALYFNSKVYNLTIIESTTLPLLFQHLQAYYSQLMSRVHCLDMNIIVMEYHYVYYLSSAESL